MYNRNKNLWVMVSILAALVASLTTAAVLLTHYCRRKRALNAYNEALNYDLDDDGCCCCSDVFDEADEDFAVEEAAPPADSAE